MLLEEAVTSDPEPFRELATDLTRHDAERPAFCLRPLDLVALGASLRHRVLTRPHRVARQRVTQPRRENLGR